MKRILMLEDGTCFEGASLGPAKDALGALVLNTSVVGYQEIMTDAANAGKIIIFTYPLIGNYGISAKFSESDSGRPAGIVIKESSRIYSNWQAESSLEDFLNKEGIACLSGIDTRTLAVKLRDDAEMPGIISSGDSGIKALAARLKEFKQKKESVLPEISVTKPTRAQGRGKKAVVIDLGVLNSTVKQLSQSGFDVTLVPYNAKAGDILSLKPQAVVVSSGPEEDPGLSVAEDTVKEILGKVPMLGISAGHQVIARALGGRTLKMKFGHRGVNYPVAVAGSLKGEITVQNHGLAVDEKSLSGRPVDVTERNLNDKTVEKIKSKKLKFISVQYYPSPPGFDEIHPVFGEFMKMIK